jgi:very-short-patch-repair endonuclease
MRKKIDEIGTGKWASHFGKFSGRSKAEIKFYNYIKENIEPTATANEPIGAYIVDVIVNKKIIEFYGDFWHANPMIYKSNEMLAGYMEAPRLVQEIWNNDKKRVDTLRAMGYDVLEIWESDWKKLKNQSINKIKQFLYGNS